MATESSVVPSVFTTDDRMTLVSSWTTLWMSPWHEEGRSLLHGARKPRSPFESGLPEGQTPRDDIVGHHFGAKNSMFFHAAISNYSSREREGCEMSQVCAWTALPRGRGPDSDRKVWTKRLLPNSG